MKHIKIIALLFILLPVTSFISNGQKIKNPTYYLNLEKLDTKNLYINSKYIDSIKIEKKTENGEVYIYTKKKEWKFLSLDDVLKKHTDVKVLSGNILVRIDEKIVDDIENIRIDETFEEVVIVKTLSDTKYLSDKFRDLLIIDIYLNKKPSITIRGNNEELPFEVKDVIKE